MRARRVVAVVAVVLAAGCGGGGSTKAGAAVPADPAKATRMVEVKATNDLRFDPSTVKVKTGETVTFVVSDVANVAHEFVVGDAAYQVQHEKEMQQMAGGAEMGDTPNAVALKPGQTKNVTLTFTRTGTLYYGCHVPGHYAAGMKGKIEVA